jgi:hypothetical protein
VSVIHGEAQHDSELIREVGHFATPYDLLEGGGPLAKAGVVHIIESLGVISVDCDQVAEGELLDFVLVISDFLAIRNGADRNATVDVVAMGQVRLTEELGRRSRDSVVEHCNREQERCVPDLAVLEGIPRVGRPRTRSQHKHHHHASLAHFRCPPCRDSQEEGR